MLNIKNLPRKINGYIIRQGSITTDTRYNNDHFEVEFVEDDNQIFYVGETYYFNEHNTLSEIQLNIEQNLGFKHGSIYIIDADDEEAGYIDNDFKGRYVLISFECFKNLLGRDIRDSDFKIISHTKSERKLKDKVSQKEYQDLIKNGWTPYYNDDIPGEYNYKTLNYLHKSGGVLIKTGDVYAVFGFDDDGDQYYGIILPEDAKPKSVEAAYKSLIPEDIEPKNLIDRQGEWYFSKVPENFDLDKLIGSQAYCEDDIQDIYDPLTGKKVENPPRVKRRIKFTMPRASIDSHEHVVECEEFYIDGDKFYFLNPRMKHDQHSDVVVRDLCCVQESRHQLSVSVDGVD